MRLAVIGSGSFIASHFVLAATTAGIDVLPLRHNADLGASMRGIDVVVNFALHPDLRSGPYMEDKDFDLKAAHFARKNHARLILISTRRVYAAQIRWAAAESAPTNGDETFYGRNKSLSEAAVRKILSDEVVILRLSNIIGFEYRLGSMRQTFMASMLRGLRARDEISFDMSPATGRDFLPVEACAKAILRVAAAPSTGIFNVGSGFPTNCGDVADAVLKGYGTGTLAVIRNELRDEFYLDMRRWDEKFGPLVTASELLNYCEALGRRLRNA